MQLVGGCNEAAKLAQLEHDADLFSQSETRHAGVTAQDKRRGNLLQGRRYGLIPVVPAVTHAAVSLALAFGILIACLVIFGSLWIMANLNHNMMPAHMAAGLT
jgi:hypothetical protein